MNTKKITASIVSIATGASLLAGFVIPANAQALSVGVNASTTNAKVEARMETRLGNIIRRGDAAIEARITSLNNLSGRIGSMKNLSADEKTSISSEIQSNISGLTSLKAKLDADTDVTTAQNDEKSIMTTYRIYALIIPQNHILSAVDRINTVADMMNTIAAKLQARITADQSAGKDVSAMVSVLADLNAKISDAKAQATSAQNAVVSLKSDQGDKSVMSSNTSALKTAQGYVKAATKDLKAAREDAKNIIQNLKSLGGSVSATTTASSSVDR